VGPATERDLDPLVVDVDGTITLFAALNYLDGKLIHRTEAKHTHVEWLCFLKQIEREVPEDVDIHLIADNYCTHKHAKVKAWLEKRSRFQMHFVPTLSSWMNLVERFLADLTDDCARAVSPACGGLWRQSKRTWPSGTRIRIRIAGRWTGRRFWPRSSGRERLWSISAPDSPPSVKRYHWEAY